MLDLSMSVLEASQETSCITSGHTLATLTPLEFKKSYSK